ncbi:hypothetical protein CSOJ01_13162 [Colletotrichum sojae]|uniref:Uncharacterized protein n=1 Tax=Colletotrichum sojae TaxID=2175907 RepID=A0A8H6ITT0_9PEZI|nr:hypothetical protein CSOJ01_13162 [Colletotrichum sojae]
MANQMLRYGEIDADEAKGGGVVGVLLAARLRLVGCWPPFARRAASGRTPKRGARRWEFGARSTAVGRPLPCNKSFLTVKPPGLESDSGHSIPEHTNRQQLSVQGLGRYRFDSSLS